MNVRFRYAMLGFIIGVLITWIDRLPTGLRFAAPFYGMGIGLLIDNYLMRRRQRTK